MELYGNMKQFYISLIAVSAMAVLGIPTIAQNHADSSYSTQKIQITTKNKCEQEARRVPNGELRAYGKGISKRDNTAQKKAILRAKGELVSSMKSYVRDAAELYEKDKVVNDDLVNVEDYIEGLTSYAEGVIEHYKVECSELYKLPNDIYESHVCISIPYGSLEKTVEAVMISVNEKKGNKFDPSRAKDSQKEAYQKYLHSKENL